MATEQKQKSYGITNLSEFGRSVKDEPWFGYLKVRIFPRSGSVSADALATWCGERYVETDSEKTAYRIRTYLHKDGKRYVDCVFFTDLTEEDRAILNLRFGDWVAEKVERRGKMRRPKLTSEEVEERNEIIDAFYERVARQRLEARQESIAESRSAGIF